MKLTSIDDEANILTEGIFPSSTIDCTGSFFSFLFFLNLPFADGSLGAVKADAHFYQSLTLRMIRQHIALFILRVSDW